MPSSLAERLRERIRREGPISFADFMEAALYDPEAGYYSRGARIGEGGDFVTSPSLSPAFAGAIAHRFARDAQELLERRDQRPHPDPLPVGEGERRPHPDPLPEGEGERLDFVEVGAGAGTFLADFARALERDDPDVAARTRLAAVERSAGARERLAAFCARVLAGVEELPERSVTGWIFANELFDALPVARVRAAAGGLEELRVDMEGDRFVWTPVPAPPECAENLARFGVSLEPGQVGEIRPGAAPLLSRLARALARGRIVLFDYGHRARTLYHPLARRNGTLSVHSGGRRGGDPLERPGEQDLTAHVNWDELVAVGREEGLDNTAPIRQGRFLTESGIFDLAGSDAEKWRVYRLVDPDGMGEEISVLVLSRAMRSPAL